MMTPACEANAAMAAMKKANEAKFKAICTGIRDDGAYIEAGENDNLIVQKLAANPNTLGFFGYSFLEENTSKLKGIAINGVAPTYQTIRSFKYPGARPLYIYVKNAHVRAIPAIRAFVAEFTKESAMGPNGYLHTAGLVAAPTGVRARGQQAARTLTPRQFRRTQIVAVAITQGAPLFGRRALSLAESGEAGGKGNKMKPNLLHSRAARRQRHVHRRPPPWRRSRSRSRMHPTRLPTPRSRGRRGSVDDAQAKIELLQAQVEALQESLAQVQAADGQDRSVVEGRAAIRGQGGRLVVQAARPHPI